ncbi:coiled-coil domain-containing protein [Coniochaeta sp. 2T2.1]|nr:coiled-coil domain-containing protein [Coniochaeta sp. 2T2.1]
MAPHSESPHREDDVSMQSSRESQRETSPEAFRPHPRVPRSQAEIALIRVKNRRREYLERNPAYFKSPDHEFADPLLYDELVRQFQTPAEREADGKAKGYGRVLEGSLLRGEARLAKLTESTVGAEGENGTSGPTEASSSTSSATTNPTLRERIALEADIVALSTPPSNKEEATDRWQEFLRARFVRGGDEDFDYEKVDESEDYDTLARQDEEDAWFEDEDPDWVSTDDDEDRRDAEDRNRSRPERVLQGQTGIQDY